MAENLEILEKRIEELEQRVFGCSDKDIDYPRDTEQICSTLVQMNSQVDSAIAGRPKIQAFMKKLGDLERLLDPTYTERLTLSDEAKAEIILAEEEVLREQARNLEKVKDVSDVMSSEHMRLAPALTSKLQALSEVHIKQQDATGELSEDIKALLTQYNSIITLMSKQFIQWDENLTKLEAAKSTKVLD